MDIYIVSPFFDNPSIDFDENDTPNVGFEGNLSSPVGAYTTLEKAKESIIKVFKDFGDEGELHFEKIANDITIVFDPEGMLF